ncbi:MAG: glycosyl hydrolase family 95 catalytic domain-containing protein [Anaerolineae bacterium]
MTRTLTFRFPLPRTHTGVALGNGSYGALVWGEAPGCLHLTVSRNDFWDHRHGGRLYEGGTYERLKEAYAQEDPQAMVDILSPGVDALRQAGARPSTLLPGGRFEFHLVSGVALRQAVLDCDQGTLRVEVGGSTETIELTMSPYRDVLWIRDHGGLIEHVTARPAWEWVSGEFQRRGFAPPTRLAGEDRQGWVQDCPADSSLCALARCSPEGYALAVALGQDTRAAATAASALVETCLDQGEAAFLAESRAWWASYWVNVPQVDIPSPFFARFLRYALWKFACATNPNAARPAPLQGPWVEEYQFPPWGGDYTFNVNIEQIYTLAFCGDNLAHVLPLFDMLESAPFQETMRHNAWVLLGIDDGLLLTHSVNDLGRQCQIGFSPHSALDQAVAAWLAHLYWLYYRHTGDDTFLRERAYPFMRGVMRVYEAMLEERGDGTLWLPVSVSPEYGVTGFDKHLQCGPNASMQLACIHMLVDALTQASAILGLAPAPIWEQIEARLPRFATFGAQGSERIAIWEGQDLSVCHRHHSHLASIYPFDLTGDMSAWEKDVIANSIEHWLRMGMGAWSEWCMPWAAIIEARTGMREAPLLLLEIWSKVFVNEGMTTVYLPRFHGFTAHRYRDIDKPKETNEIMQLEGTCAGATAIYEMLVHTHGGVTKVFPATPSSWLEASFEDVPQPGGFRVSAVRREGQTQSVRVRSLRGGTLVLDVPDRASMTLRRGPQIVRSTFPLELRLRPGEVISLEA